MNRYVAAHAGTATVMVALDLLWLGVIAKPLYQQGIGHLMAEQPVVSVAVLFYLLYALGVISRPNQPSCDSSRVTPPLAKFGRSSVTPCPSGLPLTAARCAGLSNQASKRR
jgi:uncharacterized membrane protein